MFRTRRQSLDTEEDEYKHSNVLMGGVIRRVPAERPLKLDASLRPAYDEYLLGSRPEDQGLRATRRAAGDDTKLPSGIMVNGEGQFVIAELDEKSGEQLQAKTKPSADLQKMAAMALPAGFSRSGTRLRYIPGGPGGGSRYVDEDGTEIPVGGTGPGGYNYVGGKTTTRKPRITKADHQQLEQEKREREALGQLVSKMSGQHLFSDEVSSDANIAQNHSPKTHAFLGGHSRGPVDFGQMSRAFKQVGCQPFKSSKTQTSIHYTISRDNTGGESARQAKLFSGFSKKGGVCALTRSRAFVGDGDGDGDVAEDNHDTQEDRAYLHDSPIHDISYSKDDRPEIERLGKNLTEEIQAEKVKQYDLRHFEDEELKMSSEASESGINSLKPGKTRDKPLPPIIVEDPNDTVAMKRARNTLAALKSRQRKMQRFEELEDKIKKLEAERDHWKSIALKRHSEQPRPLAKFSAISSTISRDNTSGEYAQREKLLAEFGQRRPWALTNSLHQKLVDASDTALLAN